MDKRKSLGLLTTVAAGTVLYNLLKPVESEARVVQEFQKEK